MDNPGDEIGDPNNDEYIQRLALLPEGGVARMLARALDQSKSRSDKNNNFRLLEDSGSENCGKTESDEKSKRFVHEVIALFEKQKLHPPADYLIVKGWIENGCDMFLHILPAVEAALKSRERSATDPPKSWRYFAHEVYGRKKSSKETS